ncbi:MAG: MFS transporter [Chloroflexota bacterium]
MPTPQTLPRYRWMILAVAWTSVLLVFFARLGIGPMGPFLKESLEISNTQLNLLVTASGITYVPTLIGAGWLVDRVGIKRMLVAGNFIGAISLIAIFFTPSYRVMLIIMALSGLGFGCIMPSAVKSLMLWFAPRERATAMGINQSAVNVAGIIGAAVLPTIALTLGWRYGFLYMGFVALAISLFCGLAYRNPPDADLPTRAGDTSPQSATISATARLFKSRDIWVLSLFGFFLVALQFAAITNLVLYLHESLLFPAVAAGGLLAMTQFAGAFGKPGSGLISDRLLGGRRKALLMLMAGAASVMCLALGLISHNTGWLLYPILVILGVTAVGWGGLYSALAGELAGKEAAGKALGITAAILVLGAMTGPPIFGYIVDITGSYRLAWLAMALSGAISVGLASMVREHKRRL